VAPDGSSSSSVAWPAASRSAALAERYPAVAALLPRCVAAVNRAYVAGDAPLAEGDELVFVPPLGGGSPCPR
jgi:molybdopterin converting factor small subunit